MRRCQDTINPRTRSDVMTLANVPPSDAKSMHPYEYARVINIFHANVKFTHPDTNVTKIHKMDFLFVRWFGLDVTKKTGWKAKKLHQIGFLDSTNSDAFGFLDPADVVRAIHLIPRFSLGRTGDLLGPSIARSLVEKNEDWERYYIGMYVSAGIPSFI